MRGDAFTGDGDEPIDGNMAEDGDGVAARSVGNGNMALVEP